MLRSIGERGRGKERRGLIRDRGDERREGGEDVELTFSSRKKKRRKSEDFQASEFQTWRWICEVLSLRRLKSIWERDGVGSEETTGRLERTSFAFALLPSLSRR